MEYRYWFASLTGVGNQTKRKLIEYFLAPEFLFGASGDEILQSGVVNEDIADYIVQQKQTWETKKEYDNFLTKDISLVTMDMEDYPDSLREIHNAPYAIYYRGVLPQKNEKIISIVGARRPSAYGLSMAKEMSEALALNGYSVCSGMALGIDAASHQGAIKGGGKTYAFLGCGVDVVYPRKNADLYREIIKNGAVMSDFEPHTTPRPEFFPARNRLISGLSDKTVVIEARAKSGSLITADFAMEQGRDVYALPGRVTDPLSEGCLNLISQGAGIITSVKNFISDLRDLQNMGVITNKNTIPENLNLEKEEILVYSCLDFYAKNLEDLQNECGMEFLDLLSVIMRLCEYGLIKETFRNHYIRLG